MRFHFQERHALCGKQSEWATQRVARRITKTFSYDPSLAGSFGIPSEMTNERGQAIYAPQPSRTAGTSGGGEKCATKASMNGALT